MTKEEIKAIFENAEVNSSNFTEILTFFDSNHVYCVHGIRHDGYTTLSITELLHRGVVRHRELPDDIENMESLWYHEFIDKFGSIYEAMKSVK